MTWPLSLALLALLLIAVTWLAYPLGLWIVSRFRARPLVPDATTAASATVSVILATREEPDVIRARVENLLHTEHPIEQLEIIVALDAAADKSLSATVFPDRPSSVRIVQGDAPGGKAATLNAAVRYAKGRFLVFADSRQNFDRKTIPALVGAIQDARFGAVSGALTLGGSGSPVHLYWAFEKWLRRLESLVHSSIGVTGAVYIARRDLWTDIPAGTLLDDVFVPMSMVLRGSRIGFEPRARAVDVRAFNAPAESKRKARTLSGVLQLHTLLPDLLSPARNPVYISWVCHKLLRLLTPLWVALFSVAMVWLFVDLVRAGSRAALMVLLAILLVVALVPVIRRRTISSLRWIFEMQRATVMAVSNGVKGRFGVWTK